MCGTDVGDSCGKPRLLVCLLRGLTWPLLRGPVSQAGSPELWPTFSLFDNVHTFLKRGRALTFALSAEDYVSEKVGKISSDVPGKTLLSFPIYHTHSPGLQ